MTNYQSAKIHLLLILVSMEVIQAALKIIHVGTILAQCIISKELKIKQLIILILLMIPVVVIIKIHQIKVLLICFQKGKAMYVFHAIDVVEDALINITTHALIVLKEIIYGLHPIRNKFAITFVPQEIILFQETPVLQVIQDSFTHHHQADSVKFVTLIVSSV
jgi:hypothetical protein